MTTLEQIAAEAQCGISTVARVLSNSNKETRPSARRRAEEIRAIAARLGYRPSLAAKSHRTGRYGCISLLSVGDYAPGYLPPGLLFGAEAELSRHDQNMLFAHLTDAQLADEAYIPKMLRECASDGILIHCTRDFPAHVRQLLDRHAIPAIWFNDNLDADAAYPDDRRGARELTELLIGMGHRRITFVGPRAGGHYSSAERLLGYGEAMEAAGLSPRRFHADEPWLPVGLPREEAERALDENAALAAPSTALVVNEIHRAVPLYSAALRRGIAIPEDLSVAVCTESISNHLRVAFTMSLVPMEETAAAAVRMLLAKVGAPRAHLPSMVVPPRLLLGETTAGPTLQD